ncbi:MAG: hypothetical protein Q8L29_01865 [archaeon]|nr:hypothetical protein [archaeon]
MNVLQDFRNELLKRREIVADMTGESNPGFAKTIKAVVEKFKVKDEDIVIKKIESKFGTSNFLIRAFIYDSPEAKLKVEPKIKVKKEKKL